MNRGPSYIMEDGRVIDPSPEEKAYYEEMPFSSDVPSPYPGDDPSSEVWAVDITDLITEEIET